MRNAAALMEPRSKRQRVLVVGGLTRLESQYRCCAHADVTVDVANSNSSRLGTYVSHADAVVVVVPNVSHAAAQSVRRHAERLGLPVAHARSPSVRRIGAHIEELATGTRHH